MYGVCMVFKVMPLFKLHSLMERVRSGAFIGGWMNLQSIDCVKLMHESCAPNVFFPCACFV